MRTPRRRCDFKKFVKKPKRKRYDLVQLRRDKALQAEFATAVEELAQALDSDISVENCQPLIDIVNAAAERVLPTEEKRTDDLTF